MSTRSSITTGQSLKMLLISVCAILFIGAVNGHKRVPAMPAGIYMTSPTEFIGGGPVSGNAPTCREQEACGFYTFDTVTRRPRKWIPSWCKCSEGQECIYSNQNNRMKIYVHTCAENLVDQGAELE